MDHPNVQLPSWQRAPSRRGDLTRLSPPDNNTHLFGAVPSELRSIIAGYEGAREQTLKEITTTPFNQQEILTALEASTQLVSVYKVTANEEWGTFIVQYWETDQSKPDSICTSNVTTVSIKYVERPKIHYAEEASNVCVTKERLARNFPYQGTPIVLQSEATDVKAFLDVRCVFLMFKKRFVDRQIPFPIESARVQTTKYITRLYDFLSDDRGIWLAYLYLSSCIVALGLEQEIKVEYVSQKITPESIANIKRQCEVYLIAVMEAIGKLV